MAAERVDITIFGATGFTGKCVVEEFLLFNHTRELSWAVAGRNEEKLTQVLDWASKKTGQDVSGVPIVIAECNDQKSLDDMAKRTRVVINCCGPYSYYGESVVRACIQNGAHHVDVSGEPDFMERTQFDYHERAEEKEVYVISACGFDSVPVELGVVHLVKNFPGVVNSIESYVKCFNDTGEPAAHFTTWESIVNGMTTINKLEPIRKKLYSTLDNLKLEPCLEARSFVHRSPVFDNKLCVLFPGSDRATVQRTQQSLYTIYKQRPVQFRPYIVQPLLAILGTMVVGFFLFTLSKCAFGRKLLLRYPEFFTFGVLSRKGPSEDARARTFAKFRFLGRGWSKEVAEKYERPELINEPTNTSMVTEMSFPDFAYGFTAKAALLSAVTILKESEHMPLRGGVLTPGAAFAKTNFLENLAELGVSFKILSTK